MAKKKKEPINWKQLIKTVLIITIISGNISALTFIGIKTINNNSITGIIVNKYTSGPNNNICHLVVSDNKKTIDLIAENAEYNNYNLNDTVFVDYDILKNIKYIRKEKNNENSDN